MKQVKLFFKKHWFITTILVLCIIRFLFTYKLPNFYLYLMSYDDGLTIEQFNSLISGNYLGIYGVRTIIKGPIFPFLLFISKIYKMNFSTFFTLLYIFACIYFIYSLKNVIKNKKYLIIIFVVLLFNPVTYSQDLFQRLYRNSISITELLFFLGSVIRILFNKDKKILNNILFGISLSFMFLTREDNLWTYPVIIFVIVYSIFKNRKMKTVIISLIPMIILYGSLNLVSFINYKHYGIYTYNEIQKSEFHNTYKKILQIKDDEKIEKVAIPKSTLYKLSDYTKTFNLTREEIDRFYKGHASLRDEPYKGEIYNGNIIWYLRLMINNKNKFKSGKESQAYYKKLGKEIDKLFDDGTFQKEFIMPSAFMSVPRKSEIKELPKNIIDTILYTTKYKDIKTLTRTKIYKYDAAINSYYFAYGDYHETVKIVSKNPMKYEIIRIIYMWFTIIFSIVSLILYLRNIKKFDEISIVSHILMVCYLLIVGGVAYTHTTAFHAIRPLYLGNVYILQSIFILINLYRFKKFKNNR